MTPKEHAEKAKKTADKDAKKSADVTPASKLNDAPETLEPREQEAAMLNDQVEPYNPPADTVEKKGEHPFHSTHKDGKLVIKIKLSSDDFFLNPELRNLGYKEGEILEMTPVKKSLAVTHSNKEK